MSHSNWECRYCDSPFSPIQIDDELICRCGAEWEDAKILVTISDEEYDAMIEELELLTKENEEYEDDDYYDQLEEAERNMGR